VRYHVQRVGTREWLSRDLELAEGVTTRALSQPGGITGTIAPELKFARADDGLRLLEKWGSIIYAEDAGRIRGAGIVTKVGYEDQTMTVEAPGFTTYPAGLPYTTAWPPTGITATRSSGSTALTSAAAFLRTDVGKTVTGAGIPAGTTEAGYTSANQVTLSKPATSSGTGTVSIDTRGARIDPLDAARHLWDHVQSFSNGNLGVAVDQTTTPVRIGTNEEPYRLRWWEGVDVGGEFDSLAQQAPFDYTMEHTWANDARSDVAHRLRIGYPRLGRRRHDLRFVEGENVVNPVTIEDDGQEFANEVRGLGAGEGPPGVVNGRNTGMAHAQVAVLDGRLRRVVVVTDKTADQQRTEAMVRRNLRKRGQVQDISELTVIDHPNARIAAIDPGDDIYADVESVHLGRVRMWVRVLSVAEAADGHSAVLSTHRSNAFTYSATEEASAG
jgi:hypothetical protein